MAERIQNFKKLDCDKHPGCSIRKNGGIFFKCKKFYTQGDDECQGLWEIGDRIGNESKGGKLFSVNPPLGGENEYVFKQLNLPTPESRKQFLKEINLQIKASELGLSPKIYEIFLNDGEGGIVMDKMDYTVDRLIVDLLESNLTDEYKTTLIYSLVQNMFDIVKKLGDNKIFHGDIHFGNFMIKNNQMKIIDFGLGMTIKESMSDQFYLEQIANFLVVFPENSLAVTRHPEIMDKIYNNVKKNIQEKKSRRKKK